MDVSSFVSTSKITCDQCGYDRTGIGVETLCPECGSPPPRLAISAPISIEPSESQPIQTKAELSNLRWCAAGLILLIASSLLALQVAMVIPLGAFALSGINFPGPKLHAVVFLQRSVGGQPGPWGVAGTIAALGTLAGIWLITEPAKVRDDFERAFSLRRLTRFAAIFGAGTVLGLLLGGTQTDISFEDEETQWLLMFVIACCEIPATSLLYAYLRRLSNQLGEKKSVRTLGMCIWMIPLLGIAAVGLMLADPYREDFPPHLWRAMAGSVGIAQAAIGMAALAAVVRLTIHITAQAAGEDLLRVARFLRHLPGTARAFRRSFEAHRAGWCAAIGIVLWVAVFPATLKDALSIRTRTGLLSNIPMLNFAGPKVLASTVTQDRMYTITRDGEILPAAVIGLVAVWLMTVPPTSGETRKGWWLRVCTRWLTTFSVAAPAGAMFAGRVIDYEERTSSLLAMTIVVCEVPATMLVYFFLSRLACSKSSNRRGWSWLVWIVPIIAVAPIGGMVLSRRLQMFRHSLWTAGVAGSYMCVSLAVSLVAASILLKLAGELAQSKEPINE